MATTPHGGQRCASQKAAQVRHRRRETRLAPGHPGQPPAVLVMLFLPVEMAEPRQHSRTAGAVVEAAAAMRRVSPQAWQLRPVEMAERVEPQLRRVMPVRHSAVVVVAAVRPRLQTAQAATGRLVVCMFLN